MKNWGLEESDWPKALWGGQSSKIGQTSAHCLDRCEHSCVNRGGRSLPDELEVLLHKQQDAWPLWGHRAQTGVLPKYWWLCLAVTWSSAQTAIPGSKREVGKVGPWLTTSQLWAYGTSLCSSRPVSSGLAWVRFRVSDAQTQLVGGACPVSLLPSLSSSLYSSFHGPWIPLMNQLALSNPPQVLPSQTVSLPSLSLSTAHLAPNIFEFATLGKISSKALPL